VLSVECRVLSVERWVCRVRAYEEEGRVLGEKHPEAHSDRHQEVHLHVPKTGFWFTAEL